jgi:thymidylate synthase (FAD)
VADAETRGEAALQAQTGRSTVAELEAILGEAFPVLDHGFVRVVDYMGDDSAIVQAARVSYGKGTRKTREDRGLIRYLLRHRHTTPFEMCEIKLHVKLPIFVARQWIRHRTANVNEYSARYSLLDREFYIPALEQMAAQAADNRQGRGEALPPEQARLFQAMLRDDAMAAYTHYEQMVGGDGGEDGLTRELARIGLPVSYYTQWYWKIDLHNLMHFLALRIDPHAQHEIRVYGEAIAAIVDKWVPLAWEAFRDYRLEGAHLSRMEIEAIKALVRGQAPDYAHLGMSPREVREFKARFDLDLG